MPAYKTFICLDYPHQLLPALAALAVENCLNSETLLFIKYHHASKMNASEQLLLEKMLSQFPSIQFYGAKKWMCHPLIPVRLRALFLRKTFKSAEISRIFFAHDVSADFTAQMLMQAFPKAKRICYGDSLGLVYNHEYFEKLMYSHQQGFSFSNFLSKLKRWWILPSAFRRLQADVAILAIPCDPGKDFIAQCELRVPPKKLLQETIENIKKNLPGFSFYLNSILAQNKSLVILAPSNLTESKLCDRDKEIALYLDIINAEVSASATLLIKPHPGMSAVTLEALKSALEKKYKVIIFSKQYNSLPIELATELLKEATVLSISYASISIPYLYNRVVKHTLNEALIRRYIYPEKQNWLISSNDLYLQMIAALKTWNGKSELNLEHAYEN